MKLTITYFTTKLENFIDETNVTDADLLMLLSHLTDSIQSFVLAAKVIKTNHTIESIVDKNFLSCENIFECLACNVQTGKTYATVLNHISTKKHIGHVKQFDKQKKEQPVVKNSNTTTRPSSTTNPVPVALEQFLSNREMEMNPKMSIHETNSQLPVLNGPLPHLRNSCQQPFIPPMLTPVPVRSIVGMNLGLAINQIQSNEISRFGVNNNTLGLTGNSNQPSMPDSPYKELFRMPLPINVVGFQQNIISPSNGYLRNINQAIDESEKNEPTAAKTRRRQRTRGAKKNKSSKNQTVETQVKLLDEKTISFLKGDFQNDVMQFIKSAEKLSSCDLYTDITMNLQECCGEMNFNADVECFGSRIIGIGSTKSDVDLNISVSGKCPC